MRCRTILDKEDIMKRERVLIAAVALLAVLCLALPGSSSAQPAKFTLKLAHYAAENHAGQQAALMFKEGVEKRTNGNVKVEVYPNNKLGDPPSVLEQNIQGVIDMSLPTQGQLSKYSPKFGCVMIPFAYDDYAHADRVLDGPFLAWAAPDLEKAGLVFLSNWEWGLRNITNSKREIKGPEDVKGLKIRTPPEYQNQAAMEALGATVTTIGFSDLTLALKQGTVDGQENPVAVVFSNKLYETQKYMSMTGHTYNSMTHVMSKKSWDKLPADFQKIIREESQKAGAFMRKTIRDSEADQITKLKELGMVITTVDKAKFKAMMGPANDIIKSKVGAENFDAFMKMVADKKKK
jgi:tripartite ATP-independent transporter DctP family solute receptor